jgi:hypothetical protein
MASTNSGKQQNEDPVAESPGRTGVRRGLVALAVLAALGLFVLAGLAADTDPPSDDVPITGGSVEELIPGENAEVLQQQLVQIDLASGWTGELSINGIRIPEDQLERNEGLSTIGYQPGDGKVVEKLGPENCADATIWLIAEGPDGPSRDTVSWCFQAT